MILECCSSDQHNTPKLVPRFRTGVWPGVKMDILHKIDGIKGCILDIGLVLILLIGIARILKHEAAALIGGPKRKTNREARGARKSMPSSRGTHRSKKQLSRR